MLIEHEFQVEMFFKATVLLASSSLYIVKGHLSPLALPVDIDISALPVRSEVKFSDIMFLKANKKNTYVIISHDPLKIESSTTAFTLRNPEERDAFLELVGSRLAGGSSREEDAYGPFRNTLGPIAGVAWSLIMAVGGGIDLVRRCCDWQPAFVMVLGIVFSLGTIGWLVERLKNPAIIILVWSRENRDL